MGQNNGIVIKYTRHFKTVVNLEKNQTTNLQWVCDNLCRGGVTQARKEIRIVDVRVREV
jgi:hypothetical protein